MRSRLPGSVQNIRPFWVFNGLAVVGQGTTALEIAGRDDVKAVRPDHIRYLSDPVEPQNQSDLALSDSESLEWNIEKIGADKVWNALNIDGTGVVVGNMDTGVDWKHPALIANYRGNTGQGIYDHYVNWFCATNEGYTEPTDVYGHGTHTMGTMIGHTGDRPAFGVAPGAKWIAVKIFNDDGGAYDSWIHAGFEWMLDPGYTDNPELVPDIVNNSWGSDFGDDQTFRADVQAWRAAGIVPIFSAGNNGPYEGTVGSPGSYPEAITVGATNINDYIAYFSSRGPSLWGIKPTISAPGVDVLSSFPNARYATASGTSMAAPHIAGVAALIRQANPLLAINQIEDILESTAKPREAVIPNNDYGWGLVDAFQAVATASKPGYLRGSVRSNKDNAAIPHAAVMAEAFLPAQGFGQGITDMQGQYEVGLAPWTYNVTINAFGYQPATFSNITIVTDTVLARDFTIEPVPVGQLRGRVTALADGSPISATVIISDTPISVMTDPSTGEYKVDLPPGTYTIQVKSSGHRISRAHYVSINQDGTTEQDFALLQAPTILLVDSGAWYDGSQALYFQQALDDLDYLYDRRTIYAIYGTERSVPTAEDLMRYDIVIWSSPLDSPGYIGAWEALATFLDNGGKLFLTGQNIGYWDNPSGYTSSPEYSKYLQSRFIKDDSGSENLTGLSAGIFSGLSFSINGGDGATDQDSPDEITYLNEATANLLAQYDNGGFGAQETWHCMPYHTIYFSFGFEGISQREVRQEVMARVIDAFTSVAPPVSNLVVPSSQSGIQPAGQVVTYSLQIHNLNEGGQTDTYWLTLAGQSWPSSLSSNVVTVSACTVATVTARVEIPDTTAWNAFDVMTLTAQSSLSATVQATAVISTKTPAPVLLVDHDRWYDMESFYQSALEQNNLPYDYWRVGWKTGEVRGSPPTGILQMYPVIIWFTGYDWFRPVSAQEEASLTQALDSGSRLFLTSQDYLYARGLTAFGQNYLGVASYSGELTTTLAVGVRDNPVSDLVPSYSLTYPYPNRSDSVIPFHERDIAFEGNRDEPVGLTHQGTNFRTSFLAFPFETITPESGRRQVMRQMTGWLSWLGGSSFLPNGTLVASGATVTYTLTMRNDGWQPIEAHASNSLPDSLTLVPGSLAPPEANYDPANRRITWSRNLLADDQAQMTYQAVIDDGISGPSPSQMSFNSVMRNTRSNSIWDRFWTSMRLICPHHPYQSINRRLTPEKC